MDDMKNLQMECGKCSVRLKFIYETILRDYIYGCPNCGDQSVAFKDGKGHVQVNSRNYEEKMNSEMTFQKKGKEIVISDEILSANIIIGNGLLENSQNGSASFNIGIETTNDLRASIQTALVGYYRTANMLLRSWLELTTIGVYFDDHPEKFKEWQDDQRNSPSFKLEWLQFLFGAGPFQNYEQQFRLSDGVHSLYGELSKFVHARGERNWGTTSYSLGGKRYDGEYFDMWFLNLKRTFDLTSTMLFLKYPTLKKVFSELYIDGTDVTEKFLELISEETLLKWRKIGLF